MISVAMKKYGQIYDFCSGVVCVNKGMMSDYCYGGTLCARPYLSCK